MIRLEDGFLRSVGLGADLVRPLSWVIRFSGRAAPPRVNLRLEAADPADAADQARLQGYTVLGEPGSGSAVPMADSALLGGDLAPSLSVTSARYQPSTGFSGKPRWAMPRKKSRRPAWRADRQETVRRGVGRVVPDTLLIAPSGASNCGHADTVGVFQITLIAEGGKVGMYAGVRAPSAGASSAASASRVAGTTAICSAGSAIKTKDASQRYGVALDWKATSDAKTGLASDASPAR